jgi:hypothetical protein
MLASLLIYVNIKRLAAPPKAGPYQCGPSKGVAENQKSECTSSYSRSRWDVLMNRQFIVAILLVVAVPVYAHAQNLRVGDAQKVVTISSSDKGW